MIIGLNPSLSTVISYRLYGVLLLFSSSEYSIGGAPTSISSVNPDESVFNVTVPFVANSPLPLIVTLHLSTGI